MLFLSVYVNQGEENGKSISVKVRICQVVNITFDFSYSFLIFNWLCLKTFFAIGGGTGQGEGAGVRSCNGILHWFSQRNKQHCLVPGSQLSASQVIQIKKDLLNDFTPS